MNKLFLGYVACAICAFAIDSLQLFAAGTIVGLVAFFALIVAGALDLDMSSAVDVVMFVGAVACFVLSVLFLGRLSTEAPSIIDYIVYIILAIASTLGTATVALITMSMAVEVMDALPE